MSNRHKYSLIAVYIYWIVVVMSLLTIAGFGDDTIFISSLIIGSLALLFVKKQWSIMLASMGLYFGSGLIMAFIVLVLMFFGEPNGFKLGILLFFGVLNFVISYFTIKMMVAKHNSE